MNLANMDPANQVLLLLAIVAIIVDRLVQLGDTFARRRIRNPVRKREEPRPGFQGHKGGGDAAATSRDFAGARSTCA